MYAICGKCEALASGTSCAHCSVCHRTFGGIRGFEEHRLNGQCRNPADLGYQEVERDGWKRWVKPMTDEERERMGRIAR